MLSATTPIPHGVTLMVGFAEHAPILAFIAQLALLGEVQVVVGGNRFDAHALARVVRRHTTALDETLARIGQVRPFTATQTAKIVTELAPTAPIVALDLLTTFYDESITDAESARLLRLTVARLHQLGQYAPVLVTVRQPPKGRRAGLVTLLHGAAHRVQLYEPSTGWVQRRLF